MKTESDIAAYLGTESCILYAQAFSVISSVIPSFCKRGDVIVTDRATNYSVRRGIALARCNVKWYNPGDMDDLEAAMKQVAQEQAKQKKLTRRFLVAEGLSELTGGSIDLPRMVRQPARSLMNQALTSPRRSNSRKSTSFGLSWTSLGHLASSAGRVAV